MRVHKTSLPFPLGNARIDKLDGEFDHSGAVRGDFYLASQRGGNFGWLCAGVQFQRNLYLARVRGLILDDGTGHQAISKIAETRERWFHDEGFGNLEGRLSTAKLVFPRVCHRNNPVPREAIRRRECGVNLTAGIGDQVCLPEGAGEEIPAQTLSTAVSAHVALVGEVHSLGILCEQTRQ